MGYPSTYFHESSDLHSPSHLKTSSPIAKLNLPCCNLSLLLLALFTVHTENRLFPSALEQPLTYLKTVIQFPFQSLLGQNHKKRCLQHQCNLDLKFPLLRRSIPHSSVAKGLLGMTQCHQKPKNFNPFLMR